MCLFQDREGSEGLVFEFVRLVLIAVYLWILGLFVRLNRLVTIDHFTGYSNFSSQ